MDLLNCIGLSCDGASAMVGEHNSFWSRIKILTAHSPDALATPLHLLPLRPSLGFLLSEVPKWFSQSTLRREGFKTLFRVMNPDQMDGQTSTPFQKMTATHWLVRSKVLHNILLTRYELSVYFDTVEPNCRADTRYKARTIAPAMKDPQNHLYLAFATPVVAEFEKLVSV